MTCCLLIALYVIHEFSYDKHQQYADRLYQLGTMSREGDVENRYPSTPAPMAPKMEEDYPEVVASTRLLIFTARMIGSGMSPREACLSCLAEPLSDDPQTVAALMDVVDVHFG